ncbi:hypothetical protein BurJ1DRAFT_2110 [Burkholderiales bacterium JOSHI_001]|nr:hypothetical protein BurJ1DRAFT_2110 [Burkholderiales bacterium JOSHI_001]
MNATDKPPQKITPCLWFNFNAEEAVNHYLSVFGTGRVLKLSRYGDWFPEHKGKALMIEFELFGQTYQALNGGPQYPFSEAVSLSVACDNQAEVDRLWDVLTADGGQGGRCGWLKDRFGLSWQLVPTVLGALMSDPERGPRVAAKLMTMDKLDIAALQAA